MSIADKLPQVAENVSKVHNSGKKAEYDAFWDAYQIPTNDTMSFFSGRCWNDETFKPNKDIEVVNGYMMFYSCGITGDLTSILESLGVSLVTSRLFNAQYMFWNSWFTRIPEIDIRGTTISGQTASMFASVRAHTIDKLLVKESNVYDTQMFTNATRLENITFEGVIGNSINFQWCPLSNKSISNIIEHLSPTVTGQTVTFKKSAKEAAFADNEWAELIAPKPNWTFSLI